MTGFAVPALALAAVWGWAQAPRMATPMPRERPPQPALEASPKAEKLPEAPKEKRAEIPQPAPQAEALKPAEAAARRLPANAPERLSAALTPSSGFGRDGEFTLRATAASGRALREVRLLVNADFTSEKACYVYYTRESGKFSLVADSGSGTTTISPGAGDILANSQCMLDAAKSTAEGDERTLTVKFALRFYTPFSGAKTLWNYAAHDDGSNTGLEKRGTWTVPAALLQSTSN